MRIILCSVDESLSQAWESHGSELDGVEIHRGRILELEADSMRRAPQRARPFHGTPRLTVFFLAAYLFNGFVPLLAVDFDREVAPLLVSHCLECHRGESAKAGLDLTTNSLATKGGESGTAIHAGDAAGSLLWQRVSAGEMPPHRQLSESDKATIKKWIDEGADWSHEPLDLFSVTTNSRAGRDWWSLKPLRNIPAPKVDSEWGRNAIDAFVFRKLQAENLHPSPDADPRQLVRRLYFDLIGLPPTPETVADFVSAPTESAYQSIVENLLASSHFGERWGRHWLDVVRFGESDGFERNFQREHAWHYRDWVINALNEDMPYDQFARMQLIGDRLSPGMQGAAATGFWVAGVHNTTVGGSERMKQLARQDEIEEVLGTVGQAFLGLTFNCARCHDHKFDPITQREYYQLASTISGLGFGERDIVIADEQSKLEQLDLQLAMLKSELSNLKREARAKALLARGQIEDAGVKRPAAVACWEFDNDLTDLNGQLHGTAHGKARVETGALILDGNSFVETAPLPQTIAERTLEAWVQLENLEQRGGAALSISSRDGGVFDAIVFGEREPKRWMAGSNSFVRTESFGGAEERDADSKPVHIVMVYQKDGTIAGYRNGLLYGRSIRKAPLQTYQAGATSLLFGLRHKPAGGNRFLKGKLFRAAIYDRALSIDEIADLAVAPIDHVSETELLAQLSEAEQKRCAELTSRLSALLSKREQQSARATQKVYTLAARRGDETRVLMRGDPDAAGEVVAPATTAAISGLSAEFGLAPNAPEADRRRMLAQWLTHQDNPLFARVIVNRIWHYHFGRGIVETPNDFGFNGGLPSHPELLDYLAWQLRQNGYRLKWLHQLIVSSSSYRQATQGLAKDAWQIAANKDAENRLLWRSNVRRLEAEALRDAMLHVSGTLNPATGGASFKDVSVTLNNGTTYYAPIDVDGPEFFRRTVYRFNPRGGRSALLDTFDCPDPASMAPRRSVTTTPLQSLSLMNNSLVLTLANYFANRVREESSEDVSQQISLAWQLAIARNPSDSELELSEQLVEAHGLPALCRGLFNLNEFVIID